MRVAFITNRAPHYRRPLFEELDRRLDVDFYFFGGRERYGSRNITHQPGAYRTVDLRRIEFGHQTILPGLAARLTPTRYDVVVKCLNGRLMVPWVMGLAKVRQLPLVLWSGIWYQPTTPFHRLTRSSLEASCRRADAIVAYGDHVKHHLTESAQVDPSRVFVAGQAVDGTRFAEARDLHNRNGHREEVLFIGRLEPEKGLDTLFDAFEHLSCANARLRIAGTGSLEAHLKQRAESDDRISFLGHVSQERLPAELARARCLVLPSVTIGWGREPWGLVVNEAMHAGVPVIASDAVGAAAGGLVVDGRNGRVFPEGDAVSLAEAIYDLHRAPDTAREMGSQASEDVSRFSFEAMASAFESACEYAIRQRAK